MKEESSIVWSVIVVLIFIGVAVWINSAGQPAAPVAPATPSAEVTPPPPASVATPVTLDTAVSAKLGVHLVATNGLTLYSYKKDTKGVSNCSGVCAANWPPYTVSSPDSLLSGPAISGSMATISRVDGSLQVTYNGAPLYFFGKDSKPGDVNGQGVGGVWYVVKP